MSMTALDLSPEALKRYRPHEAIRRRKSVANAELSKRRRRAMMAARKAADLLRSEFGANEVFVFGSLVRRGGLHLGQMSIWLHLGFHQLVFLKRLVR